MYHITTKSADGRIVYFDGVAFSLLSINAVVMSIGDALEIKANISYFHPRCELVAA